MDRRGFLKLAALTPLALSASGTEASEAEPGRGSSSVEFVGMLIDTTLCIGCQACEVACAEENRLPYPDVSELEPGERQATTTLYTPVSRFDTAGGRTFVKRACMHCNQPACASACLTKAMEKTIYGPVVWHEDRCLGCRYCMIACPFDVPKFEYDKPIPKIAKCTFCPERLKKGQPTACAEACPQGAVAFGSRRQLLNEARRRIATSPGRYQPIVYGDHDVGGTCVMYISGSKPDEIGFRTDLGTRPFPEYTKEFLYAVPIVDILLPVLLFGFNRTLVARDEDGGDER
jgi:Fe-S-cluster-containing dehydrogenase component